MGLFVTDRFADLAQRQLIYFGSFYTDADLYPARMQLAHAKKTAPKQGYEIHELEYSVAAGILPGVRSLKMRGLLLAPSRGSGGDDPEKQSGLGIGRLWVIFGGNGMVSSDWLSFLQAILSSAAGRSSTRRQDAFLLLDFPGYWHNEGQPSAGLTLRASEAAVRAALDFLRGEGGSCAAETEKPGPEALAYLGHSLGCAAVTQLAASLAVKRPSWLRGTKPVSRLVISAPFTSIPGMGRVLFVEGMGLKGARAFAAKAVLAAVAQVSRHVWDNESNLRALARASSSGAIEAPTVAILHGSRDAIVPVQMGRQLHRLCLEVGLHDCTWVERPDADHNDLLDKALADFARLLDAGESRQGRL